MSLISAAADDDDRGQIPQHPDDDFDTGAGSSSAMTSFILPLEGRCLAAGLFSIISGAKYHH